MSGAETAGAPSPHRAIFERSGAVQLLIDPSTGAIVDANASAVEFYGYAADELLRLAISDIDAAEPEAVRARMARGADEERTPVPFRHRLKSGEIRDVEVHSSPVVVDGRVLLHSIVRDTTDRLAENALREAEVKYRTLVEGSLAGVYIIQDGVFAYANPKLGEIFGCPPGDLVGTAAVGWSAPGDRDQVAESLARRLETPADTLHYSFRGRRRDGAEIDVEVLCSRIEYGGRPAIAGTLVDVTERRRSETLRSALYRIAAETASAGDLTRLFERVHATLAELIPGASFAVALADDAGAVSFAYPGDGGYDGTLGLVEEVVREGAPRLAIGPAAGPEETARLAVPLRSGKRTIGAIVVLAGPGAAAFGEPEKELLTFVAQHVAAAIESRRAEDRIRHLAFHDPLTDLPNRILFHDRLTVAVAQARRSGARLGVMFLDIDRFKVINDSLGHSVGDELLRAVAVRIGALLREGDTLARLGGDEFILLLPQVGGVSDAVRVSEKILRGFREPFPAGGQELFITASAGVSLFPFDGEDAETLVRNADIAMYRAKEQGRDTFQLYTADLNARAQARMKLESDLRNALRREEFFLKYQPQVDLRTGRIAGFEALVYWRRADAVVPPAEFIGVAEETGLILPLGSWVLRRACRDWKERAARGRPVPVAINLSARQFLQPALERQVREALGEFGIEPGWLDLEITESVAMENADQVVRTLRGLKRLGVRLTMDDFGTGYSSLAYLKRFPLDTLKIDRAFVRDLAGEGADRALVSAVIALAHGIGLRVIAEGVETEEQRGLLAGFGCDGMQGFLVSGPVPAEELPALLEARGASA